MTSIHLNVDALINKDEKELISTIEEIFNSSTILKSPIPDKIELSSTLAYSNAINLVLKTEEQTFIPPKSEQTFIPPKSTKKIRK